MPLDNCKDRRNTCGTPLPSTCVGYDGALTGVLKDEKFECNINIDDVIERLSTIIQKLKEEIEILKNK